MSSKIPRLVGRFCQFAYCVVPWESVVESWAPRARVCRVKQKKKKEGNRRWKKNNSNNKRENLYLNTLFTLITMYFRTAAVTFQGWKGSYNLPLSMRFDSFSLSPLNIATIHAFVRCPRPLSRTPSSRTFGERTVEISMVRFGVIHCRRVPPTSLFPSSAHLFRSAAWLPGLWRESRCGWCYAFLGGGQRQQRASGPLSAARFLEPRSYRA